jgi:hypothetical protein
MMRVASYSTVRPELVEGLPFCGRKGKKEGQGFDKLSPNGFGGAL